MPELPDVENYRQYLDAKALKKTVEQVEVKNTKVLDGISAKDLDERLRGHQLVRTRRHGKYLLAALDDNGWLTLHFGMTGTLAYFDDAAADPRYDRIRFDFENGCHLAYVNQRLLGRVGLTEDADDFIAGKDLGPDALALAGDEAAFRTRFAGKRGQMKSALMDQSFLAGIGNEYSDEILFQMGLHPKMPVDSLTPTDIDRLAVTVRKVLDTAIDCDVGWEGGAERLPDSFLLPRRKEGAPCPRCGGQIKRLKTGGRSGYHCPKCQPESPK